MSMLALGLLVEHWTNDFRHRFGPPRRKVLLTEHHRHGRVVWSLLHHEDDFTRTVFVDGACVALGPGGRITFWHPTDAIPAIENHQFPPKVHILAAVSDLGVVGDAVFAERWNAGTVCDAMAEEVVPAAFALFGNDFRIQMDNATAHTALQTREYLLANGVPELLFQPSG
eukprot:scpid95366/ scgid1883/ 